MPAALGFFACLALLAAVVALVPGASHLLAGEHPADRPNYVRNALELLSFASGGVVAAIALAALGFARGQVREAAWQNEMTDRAARREALERSFARLMSDDVQPGLDVCSTLALEWERCEAPGQTLGAFVLARLGETEAGKALPPEQLRAVLRLLAVVETYGLLVRLRLIDLDLIYFIWEGVLVVVDKALGDYMRRERELSNGRSSEHALWLIEKLRGFRPKLRLLP